ncbi:MAG: acyl-CoA dehydrogenase family protein [Gemmatimonadetes bacterium]|nr:acyl-CoA dehydrogenase family protein [Gemmatimonadota bacterium]
MSQESRKSLATEQEAREVVEAAREKEWKNRSFARGLYNGKLDLSLVHPLPKPDPEVEARAKPFLEKLEEFTRTHIDGDAIDRDRWVPQEVLDGLAEIGAFGIKIPIEYGGLGLSQYQYNKALAIVGSRCASTGAFLSAHQSIGAPQPLIYFGTEEQKRKYLPRLAAGALSAFALTEQDVGSDPANLSTHAELSDDGEHWILNGTKLWCTNGPRAEIIVVMVRTPAREGVKSRKPITAFIVETAWEGVEVVQTCSFMGLNGLSNGVLTFDNVKIPKENLLWGEGKGLKLALITLNTGRLSIPAFCATGAKAALLVSRTWAAERIQWGAPVGKHGAVAQMLGKMAANTFALDSVVKLTALMADAKTFDIRLEAAIAKMWNSETSFQVADDAIQIRGGRGYERADSLRERGEHPYALERGFRDSRINMIFEGSSEIMRLFIAREAVDSHLSVAGDLIDPKAPLSRRLAALVRSALHYAVWYPSRWLTWGRWPRYREFGPLAKHMRYANRASARLARSLFYAMIRFGPGLERKQAVLGRIVDIGAELFVMVATTVNAKALVDANPSDRSPYQLADVFCRHSRTRIRDRFRHLFVNHDVVTYQVAQDAMKGSFEWLEEGLLTTDWVPQPDGGADDESIDEESTGEGTPAASREKPDGEPDSAPIREPAGHA